MEAAPDGPPSAAHRRGRCIAEARAYLDHPLLGARLRGCTMLVNAAAGPIEVIFGWPDYLEFHSSMTLFAHAAREKKVFLDALEKHVAGTLDASTTDLMSE